VGKALGAELKHIHSTSRCIEVAQVTTSRRGARGGGEFCAPLRRRGDLLLVSFFSLGMRTGMVVR